MYLNQLHLRDFRNYEALQVTLGPGMTVLHGPNGAGKTNLLEAIQVGSTAESPRTREAGELIRFGQRYAFVSSRYAKRDNKVELDLGLANTGQRRIKINGVIKQRADLIGLAPVAYFSADDVALIKGEPSRRRRLLDLELSSLSRSYYSELSRYRRALEHRNRLLRDLRARKGQMDALSPWDRVTTRYGARVMIARRRFIAQLAVTSAEAHARLTGGKQQFSIEYRPSLVVTVAQEHAEQDKGPGALAETIAQEFEEVLRRHRELDLAAGITTVGPHRDDYEVLLEGRRARSFGSQGEQRAAALAVRLGAAATAEQLTGERPVLLLDDVLSELDERYRAGVFAACEAAEQTVITACDLCDVPARAIAESTVCEVRDGRIV